MMTESQRAEVVRVARSFIGTPYHHMGRVKGAGVDCATLLAEVYYEAGVLKEPVRIEYYPMDWHLHRDDERYLQTVQRYCHEIPAERLAQGDIVIYHFGRAWSHGGIVIQIGDCAIGDRVIEKSQIANHEITNGSIAKSPN